MPRIRLLTISHFRAIEMLRWAPSAGLNCLIGPGDAGKTSILDAIALVLSPTHYESFRDTDFHGLDIEKPIDLRVTLGELPDELQDIDRYGECLQGWDAIKQVLHDEPVSGDEPALTIRVQVGANLEPQWSLHSSRTESRDEPRALIAAHRALVAAVRLGSIGNSHLSWTRSSVLNRLTEARADARALLTAAARELRTEPMNDITKQLEPTLALVRRVAQRLAVSEAQVAMAALDVLAASSMQGSVTLHSASGVPLRCLGTGSSRLLVTGLMQDASVTQAVALVDEAEHGLEPHRVARLLTELGARDPVPRQTFLTSHSGVVLRELRAEQLWVLRRPVPGQAHAPTGASCGGPDVQATLRSCPEGFLASAVIVGEGATEVGLLRGLDRYWASQNMANFAQCGVTAVDGAGIGYAPKRAAVFAQLGYLVALFVDRDEPMSEAHRQLIERHQVTPIEWPTPHCTESALFAWLPWEAVPKLIGIAIDASNQQAIENQIRAKSATGLTLEAVLKGDNSAHRQVLGKAAKSCDWYKRIDIAERVAVEVVGPYASKSEEPLKEHIAGLRRWIDNVRAIQH